MGIIVRGRIVRVQGIPPHVQSSDLTELGRRLRERRKALGWSQEEFASRAGVDRSYVGGVERGQRNITFTMLCQLCGALGCDVADVTVGIPGGSDAVA